MWSIAVTSPRSMASSTARTAVSISLSASRRRAEARRTSAASNAPREKGVSATDELDLGPIFSNIALALRQLEPEEKGISDAWRSDAFHSSFQSVSFASPFEDRERLLGAELRSAL